MAGVDHGSSKNLRDRNWDTRAYRGARLTSFLLSRYGFPGFLDLVGFMATGIIMTVL